MEEKEVGGRTKVRKREGKEGRMRGDVGQREGGREKEDGRGREGGRKEG
jgi:hypothetical protein